MNKIMATIALGLIAFSTTTQGFFGLFCCPRYSGYSYNQYPTYGYTSSSYYDNYTYGGDTSVSYSYDNYSNYTGY